MVQPIPGGKRSTLDEVLWTIRRCRILFHYWTIPVALNPFTPTETDDDRTSTRAFALLLIVALTFAVRGDVGHSGSFAPLSAALAAFLSVILNIFSKAFAVTVRDPALIKSYTSVVVVMVLYVVFQTLLGDANPSWYQILTYETGYNFAPALLATIATYLLLIGKAKFIDGNTIKRLPAIHGLVVTICAGLIVWAISFASNDFFKWILALFGHK